MEICQNTAVLIVSFEVFENLFGGLRVEPGEWVDMNGYK